MAPIPAEGYGESQEKALFEFFDTFDFQYQSLVETPIGTLTPDGVTASNILQAYVQDYCEV